MEFHFKIVGGLLIVLSLIHVVFPAYFKWQKDLGAISLINRQMMYVHTFFIALVVLLIGILSLTSSHELISTEFGKRVSFGIGLFWLIRLFVQFFGYSSQLWRGKVFETSIHVLFSLFWVYLSILFLMPIFY